MVRLYLFLACLIVSFGSLINPGNSGPLEDKISPSASTPITKKGSPKTYAKWGKTGIMKINKLMPLAARKAAESLKCDYVQIADLSDRSEPPASIIFFVDCKNGKRFYISEKDIKSSELFESTIIKTSSMSDPQAIAKCEKRVKKRLNYLFSFDRHSFSSIVRRVNNGNVVVSFTFDAKNACGAEFPYHAKCVIDDRGMHSTEITFE